MPDDKKKYPWIKSIFGSKKRKTVECVYAGPEVMKKRVGRTEKVYAGPPPKTDEKKPVYAAYSYCLDTRRANLSNSENGKTLFRAVPFTTADADNFDLNKIVQT